MNLNLEGKVALVTGGAKGIGAAIVRSFANEGALVSIVDRNPQVANELIQDIAGEEDQVFCIPTELTDEAACQNAVEQTIQKKGRIDFLIHNAGTNDGVDLKAKPSDFFESLRKNLLHVFSLTHFALAELEKNQGKHHKYRLQSCRDWSRRNLRLCRLQGCGECSYSRVGSGLG